MTRSNQDVRGQGRRRGSVLVAAPTVALLTACGAQTAPQAGPSVSPSAGAATRQPSQTGPSGVALRALDALAVKGRAPRTGYSRARFGPAWADVDHNG